MPLSRLTCPSCGVVLKPKTPVPEGKRVKCPTCKGTFIAALPAPPSEEAAEPPRATKRRRWWPVWTAAGLLLLLVVGGAAVLVFTLRASNITLQKVTQVKGGMSEAQVKAVLGEPARREDGEMYPGAGRGSAKVLVWESGWNNVKVVLADDEVVGYTALADDIAVEFNPQ